MKTVCRFLFVALLMLASAKSFGQGMWTWMSGPNVTTPVAVYGTQGVPSANNLPPPQYSSYSWTDLNGNFWLYGGNSWYADMWMFNPTTLEWTWVKGPGSPNVATVYGVQGIPSPINTPGSRGYNGLTWTDTAGYLWLYGGFATSCFGDLWRYDITTNEWTWMSGDNTFNELPVYGTLGVSSPSARPGNRAETGAGWRDATNRLWFYGGWVDGSDSRADMWMYDPATNEWTWQSGTQATNSVPLFGAACVYSALNSPGGRSVYSTFVASSGEFYAFGGGVSTTSAAGDLFKYDPLTKEWAWVNGVTASTPGIFGNECESDSSYYPGSRRENRASWVDDAGNLWLYGGFISSSSAFSDTWVYLTACNEWARMQNGSLAPNYGVAGVSSVTNNPGGRIGTTQWTDTNGHFWMFGAANSTIDTRSDMWRYIPDLSCVSICESVGPPTSQFSSIANHLCCTDPCVNFTNQSLNATSFQWFFPGGTPSTSIQQNPDSICYFTAGVYDVVLVAFNANGSDTTVLPAAITVSCLPAATITFISDTLWSTLADAYQWYLDGAAISGATNPFLIPNASGIYSVETLDSAGCTANSSYQLYLPPQATIQPIATKICPDSCISFGNNSTNASSYEWFFDGATPNYSTDSIPTNICYPTSGLYDVTLIVHNGPYSDTTTSTNLIQVYTSPTPIIIQSNDSLLITNVTGSNTYQWFYNGSVISGATNSFFIPTQNGNYTVIVSSPQGCDGSDDLQVVNLSVNTIAANGFQLFPNPADESVTIVRNNFHQAVLKLYNTLGQTVVNTMLNKQTTLDLSLLPAGMYYLTVQSHNDVVTKKLIVGHR